jgi:hypothetical protein
MVSPVDSLNSGGDRNHDISSPFRHFCKFTSLDENLLGCMTYHFSIRALRQKFYFPPAMAALKRYNEILCLHYSSDQTGGVGFMVVGPALPVKQLLGCWSWSASAAVR